MFIEEFNQKILELNKESKDVRKKKIEIDNKAKEDKEKLDKKLEQSRDNLNDYGALVEKYSIFRLEDIVLVLKDLLTFYNGEKYSYHIDNGEKRVYIITGKLNKVFDILDFVKLENWFKDLMFVSILKIDGLIIPFKISKIGDADCLECYSYNPVSKSLTYYTEVETEEAKIIKDFIDYVIDYRISNKVDVISKDDLKRLEKEYLKGKRTDIIVSYKNLDLDEQRELNDKQAIRRLMLNEIK